VTLALTVLGCSGSYPGPGQACSGYLLDDGVTRVWLDAGSGTLANLQRHVGLEALDAVVLSHEHADHCSDVEGLGIALRYFVPRPDLPVYAPAGVRVARRGEPGGPLCWHDVGDGQGVEVGTLALRFSRTEHGPETLAVRLDAASGGSVAYSADTGPGWSMASLGPGVDLALCEASLPPEREGSMPHLSARQAGATARAAGAARLVLTHLWPGADPVASAEHAAPAFGGPVEVATPGATYVVGGPARLPTGPGPGSAG